MAGFVAVRPFKTSDRPEGVPERTTPTTGLEKAFRSTRALSLSRGKLLCDGVNSRTLGNRKGSKQSQLQ